MNTISGLARPTPVRASISDVATDILRFALSAYGRGRVALATLVEIRGGAARALGAQIAIAEDGQFCGYVSGGCVEAAVASEALEAIAENRDRIVKFGEGSPIFDIVLPCGGGITIAIHVLRDVAPIREILRLNSQRHKASLVYVIGESKLIIGDPQSRTGWSGEGFGISYLPKTRVVLSGQAAEADALAKLAMASSYDVDRFDRRVANLNVSDIIDPFTAVVLLHHDIDAETSLLEMALNSDAFYIGALGSTRTHRRRTERLLARSFSTKDIDRIKAPIGMFGPTRDSSSLAISVVADIAATRSGIY